jgi:hypothetical protein
VIASSTGRLTTATGSTAELALSSATGACNRVRGSNCAGGISVCDGTAGSQVINPDGTTDAANEPVAPEEPAPVEPVPSWDFSFLKFIPGLQISLASMYFTILILTGLVLWIIVSVVSTAPFPVLKRRVIIASWIGVPAALAHASMFLFPKYFNGLTLTQMNMTFVWTEVFIALAVGTGLRRRFMAKWPSPDLLSMPLVVLVFSIITLVAVYEIVDLATFPRPSDCISSSLTFSVCSFFDFQGYLIFSAALVVLVLCGMTIPANSNLILANDSLKLSVPRALRRTRSRVRNYFAQRRERLKRETEEREAKWKEEAEKERERLEQEATGESPYPVPAVVDGAPVDGMRLKLRRSQRSTALMGKVLFALDARIELTAEEHSLVAKYRLGDTVVYESSTRERHLAAMRMHAESTRDHPGLTESAGAQALGAGKTFFRLARAGVSAASAALSLRVTVYSLIQGVHVECKSLEELIEAENAIVEAAQNLKAYLQTAVSFDGREEIIEL